MEMKPCPFCGGSGILYKQERFRNERTKNKKFADAMVEKAKNEGRIARKSKFTAINDFGEKTDGWDVWYQYRIFIPKCSNKRCIANNISMPYSCEDHAVNAWNTREGA